MSEGAHNHLALKAWALCIIRSALQRLRKNRLQCCLLRHRCTLWDLWALQWQLLCHCVDAFLGFLFASASRNLNICLRLVQHCDLQSLTGHLRWEPGLHSFTWLYLLILILSVEVKMNRPLENALKSTRVSKEILQSQHCHCSWVNLLLSLILLLRRPSLGAAVGGGWAVTSRLQRLWCRQDISGKVRARWQSTFHFPAVSCSS